MSENDKSNGISIIIPSYNSCKHIGQAIQSVIEQDYDGEKEIIISDDGSSDTTLSIALSFGDHVKILRKPQGCKSQGAAGARNRGLEAASRKYVCFLDSDDFYLPGHLKKMAEIMGRHSGIGFAFCRILLMAEIDGRKLYKAWTQKRIFNSDIRNPVVSRRNVVHTNSFLFRREVFEEAGYFDESFTNGEDADLWMRVSELFTGTFSDHYGAVYRIGHSENQLTRNSMDLIRNCHYKIYDNALKRYCLSGLSDKSRLFELKHLLLHNRYHDKKFLYALNYSFLILKFPFSFSKRLRPLFYKLLIDSENDDWKDLSGFKKGETFSESINVVVLGICCFEGMANSKRVRNLIIPLIKKEQLTVNNLIYHEEIREHMPDSGNIDGISYKVIRYSLKNPFSLFKFFSRGIMFLNEVRKRFHKNIIYNYGGPNIQNILLILYGKIAGYKIVSDITEDNRYEPTSNILNRVKSISSLLLLRYSRFYINSMIGISDHLYRRLQDLTKNKIPVFHIPISVNLDFFRNNTYIFNRDDIKIFYGGSFNEKDGLQYLIAAFDELAGKYPGLKLLLSGAAIKSDLDRVNSLINQTVNHDRIIYKGFLSTADYYEMLNNCDIYCMTRIKSDHAVSGFPFKLGEFLATGKAVIATNVGDVSKYLLNNVNSVVIDPNSSDQIVSAISSLIEHPEQIKLLGAHGRKTAESFFNSEKSSEAFYRIINIA